MEVNLKFEITEAIIIQWVIILIISLAAIILTRNLKKVPSKKQSLVEMIVEFANGIVAETIGPGTKKFVPYIGALALFILFMNLTGLVGIESPTKDYSVTLALAMISFLVVQAYAIKKKGLGHYIKGYFEPMPALFAMNIMERVMLPLSLSLRLFGNMLAATVIMELVYHALGKYLFGLPQLVIPVPLHMYFDIFDGTIQMVIFVMLTMINIKVISEH